MTPSTLISATPPAAAPAAVETPAAAAPAVDGAALQQQIEDLREQVAEAGRTAQYWADKARTATPAPAAAAVEDETDVLEAITTGGAKGFDALAKKRGFVQRSEVEELIAQRANSLTAEQDLLQRFPDLKKKDSEFFKATSMTYAELVKAGTPQPVAMVMAADKTELEFMRAGKIKTPAAQAAQTAEEKEAARVRRVAAQAGEGGDRRPAAGTGEDDGELTPEQKHIARAMGITEEAYAKRAKAGVSIKGGLGGNR